MTIRELRGDDWPEVARIYAEGLHTGTATFQTEVPEQTVWNDAHLPCCRLCACEGALVLGWAALSPVSARPVYRGVAEVSIYVGADARGRGVGRALMAALITASESAGIWTLQSSVIRENRASAALHASSGFRLVGCRERIARDARGVWRDTLLFERRANP